MPYLSAQEVPLAARKWPFAATLATAIRCRRDAIEADRPKTGAGMSLALARDTGMQLAGTRRAEPKSLRRRSLQLRALRVYVAQAAAQARSGRL